jgi:hypothetical protein
VFLTSALIEATNDEQVRFVISHELAHRAAGYLNPWTGVLRMPSRVVPFLHPAYSRAREYTAERIAHISRRTSKPRPRRFTCLVAAAAASMGRWTRQLSSRRRRWSLRFRDFSMRSFAAMHGRPAGSWRFVVVFRSSPPGLSVAQRDDQFPKPVEPVSKPAPADPPASVQPTVAGGISAGFAVNSGFGPAKGCAWQADLAPMSRAPANRQ